MVAAAETHYGHAGRAFLENLTRDKRDWQAHYDAFKAMSEFTVGGADGQVKRAASKFVVAMAGELAIEYGIVPWPKGDAIKAVIAVRSQNDEPRQILRQMRTMRHRVRRRRSRRR